MSGNENIHQAIETYLADLPDAVPGEDPGILGDWIAVASMVRVDEEGQPRTQYYLMMRGGSMLPHVAKGLLHEGLREAEDGTEED